MDADQRRTSGRRHDDPVRLTDGDGWPMQSRGVVPSAPGLYFLSLPFLYSFTSMLVAGAGPAVVGGAAIRLQDRRHVERTGRYFGGHRQEVGLGELGAV